MLTMHLTVLCMRQQQVTCKLGLQMTFTIFGNKTGHFLRYYTKFFDIQLWIANGLSSTESSSLLLCWQSRLGTHLPDMSQKQPL